MIMKRTQIYLTEDQHNFVENLAFLLSKKGQKKISVSEIIRKGIEILKDEYSEYKDETDFILNSPYILEGFEQARNEKVFYDYKDVFGS